jgi:hypothetical protein
MMYGFKSATHNIQEHPHQRLLMRFSQVISSETWHQAPIRDAHWGRKIAPIVRGLLRRCDRVKKGDVLLKSW